MPTARAEELGGLIIDILAQARRVVASAEPFNPTTSTRRFSIGAPNGALAMILVPLLEKLRRSAPGVDIGIRQILPPPGVIGPERAWTPALADLEARDIDVAIVPADRPPARFVERTLFREDFVVGMRKGHPFAEAPTLDRYCEMRHLVVSMAGEAHGFVDTALAAQGRSRRIAATVPNFMLALALLSETELIAALPRKLLTMNARRFDLQGVEPPLPLPDFPIRAVATRSALMDAGVAWLSDALPASVRDVPPSRRVRHPER